MDNLEKMINRLLAKKQTSVLAVDNTADNDDCATDFTLVGESAWITVNNLSVHIKKEHEGVVVDIYGRGSECDDPIASTYAFYNEAEEVANG